MTVFHAYPKDFPRDAASNLLGVAFGKVGDLGEHANAAYALLGYGLSLGLPVTPAPPTPAPMPSGSQGGQGGQGGTREEDRAALKEQSKARHHPAPSTGSVGDHGWGGWDPGAEAASQLKEPFKLGQPNKQLQQCLNKCLECCDKASQYKGGENSGDADQAHEEMKAIPWGTLVPLLFQILQQILPLLVKGGQKAEPQPQKT